MLGEEPRMFSGGRVAVLGPAPFVALDVFPLRRLNKAVTFLLSSALDVELLVGGIAPLKR